VSFVRRHKLLLFLSAIFIFTPAVVIWTIAGSDRLFLKTVPIEQRLVSQNENIRMKAQQELLGLSQDAKQQVTARLIPILGQPDRIVRKWAVIALALMGPAAKEAIPALLQELSVGEKDVVEACRVALSEIGAPDPEQLPQLLQSLQDDRPAVRCEAAAAMAKLGPEAKEAVSPLIHDVRSSADVPSCTGKALAMLADTLPEVQGSLLDMLRDPSVSVRRNAAYVLSQMTHPTDPAIDGMLASLADETESPVRQFTAKALTLRQAPDRGLLPSWTYTLRRARNNHVRAETLRQLENQNLEIDQVGPSIWGRVKDEDPDIRLEAVQWIGRSGPAAKPAVSYLLAGVSDPDVRVRRAALSALKRSGTRRHEGLQLIGKAQRDPDPLVRCVATEELLELGSADRVAVPLLVNDLKGEDDSARCAAEALGLAGHFNHDVVPALIKVLQEKDPLSRSRAALILMQLGARAREAIPALVIAQKDGIPDADNALKVIRESLPRSVKPRHKKS